MSLSVSFAHNDFMIEYGEIYDEVFQTNWEKMSFSDICLFYSRPDYDGNLKQDLENEYHSNPDAVECALKYIDMIKRTQKLTLHERY